MATFSINTLTEKGTEMMATALATAQGIEFTALAIGDGAAPENPETLTDLVNKVMDVEIAKVYRAASEPGTSIFRASFQNKTGSAFRFREAGIYARLQGTADDPILYGYANAGDTADLIDTVEEGSLLMQTLLCNIVTGSAEVQLIDNPSAPLSRRDFSEYLPLTGGTMTGYIVLDPNGGTKNNYNIGYDFDAGDGAGIALRSKNREGDPGSWVLYAKNGNTVRTLVGKTDGTMTWDGGAFVCTEANVQFKRTDTSGCLTFHGGTNTENGSGLFLYGQDYTADYYKGDFLLRAAANGQIVDLRGQPDGTLTWGSANVLTSLGGDLNGELHHTKYGAPAIRYKDGAALFLFPMGQEFYKGGFILRAYSTNDQFIDLQGWADGRLHWNGNDILTTAGGNVRALTIANNTVLTSQNATIGYLDYANAISLPISSNDTTALTYTAPNNGMFYLICKNDDRASIAIGKLTLAIGDTGYTRPNVACVPLRKGDVVTYITTNMAYFVKSKY